ncbi:hypothetical protein HII31_06006 [Pseudocercospora fuligena]|uniref:Uncharacterized protein n=1 Tax=Pseudocercospora fuligena TaxID=685502 RepID=A0A8H6RKM7_9PEZI|nr:hypothetical protein HII31_06006 [Pseudocercospora fuligena]
MGKAYSEEQRNTVRALLESGRDEESIEKETGVSDRTIRRWKLELERTGRIGKPPEARTGRHRVLSAEIEQALFDHVKQNQNMSVDDMLWWLYDTHKIVVGTRTIRRVFERKGDKFQIKGKSNAKRKGNAKDDGDDEDDDQNASPLQTNGQYQSPYAPMAQQAVTTEQQLAQALQAQHTPQQNHQNHFTTNTGITIDDDLPEDEETIELQLQQIALQKREVELKLKMRRLQNGKNTPASSRKTSTPSTQGTSVLYQPGLAVPTPPKRDSRSKKKIEESKRRTAERQERMLRDLERRSRRRDHLTAEWVQSKDIWPLRAQGLLADLMHQYGYYAFSQNQVDTFETMYRDLYQLVDLVKGDWVPQIHDEMLRERMKRKMGQLRTKMQKTGEIVTRTDGYGGFQKADDYTGAIAGADEGDESEMVSEMQVQPGAPPEPQVQDQIQYDPMQDHTQMQAHHQMPYAMMQQHQGPAQYPGMMDHTQMLPYGQMNGMNAAGPMM